MGFIADIERQSQSTRQAILAHPFVTGVGDGTLPMEKFKYYVVQDYAYLIDYSRALALASARAPLLDDMSWFAGLLDETLNVEMALHRSQRRAPLKIIVTVNDTVEITLVGGQTNLRPKKYILLFATNPGKLDQCQMDFGD